MWITDIRVDGFGVWNTVSVDELSPTITLFYGPNEAGKTTLMQFVRAALYGFSEERRKLYLPPVYGGVPGGLIRAENHNGGFVIERRESEKDTQGEGRVIVLSDNGSRQGQHLLNVLLSGIDESIFNNVFAVGIRELQELATLNDTQAAEQLYNMASGVDRVSLVEVMRSLQSDRDTIYSTDGTGELVELRQRRDRIGTQIAELRQETSHWMDLTQQRIGLVEELTQLDDRIGKTQFQLRTSEIASQVAGLWDRRAAAEEELEELGELQPLPEGCLEQLSELKTEITALREQLRPQKKRRREIRRELAAQPINRALWDHSCRIEAVCEHGPWVASLDAEIQQLSEAVESTEVELVEHDDALGSEAAIGVAGSPAVTEPLLRQLEPAARALQDASRKRSIAKKVQRKSRQEVDDATADLQEELDGYTPEEFDEALEQAAESVKLLRRQIQLEERLEAATREQRTLDEEYDEILDDQIQNGRILAVIGAIFVFGFVLVMTGIFGWRMMPMTAELCFGIGGIGAICILLSAAWKIVLEKTGQSELDECVDRRDEIDEEIEAISREQHDIQEELPEGRGTLSSRLSEAEKELHDLEEQAPLQEERAKAAKRHQRSGRTASGADDDLRDARRRWKRALREAGLSDTLTPKLVRKLAVHQEGKAQLEGQLAEQKEKLERITEDRQQIAERLEQLTADVGLSTSMSDPQIQISQLATALAGQREMANVRRELKTTDRQLRQQLAHGVRKLRQLDRDRESLLAEARVSDEQELAERAAALDRAHELEQLHDSLSKQIEAVIAGHCEEDEIAAEFERFDLEELKQRISKLGEALETHQNQLAQAHRRHGEIDQELKLLGESRQLAQAQLELACVDTEIQQVVQRWVLLSATLRLLEEIRETYEVERQPETLSEASLYLERLTGGKYARIWTPLGKNELRIDDQDGQPLPLEVLSRGTRETVFLALRLALVAAYGRRGVTVPMILDDILVNLDVDRARAAVDVLCDFAREGRQLLFFTCHEHIKAMFVAAGIDTRVLPAHQTPGVHVVPLLEQHPLSSETEPSEPEPEPELVATEPQPEPEPPAPSQEVVPEEEPPEEIVAVEEAALELAEDDLEEETEPETPTTNEQSDPEPFEGDDFWWWESRLPAAAKDG